jgi:hypothetical protein
MCSNSAVTESLLISRLTTAHPPTYATTAHKDMLVLLTVRCELPRCNAACADARLAVCRVHPVQWALLALVQQPVLHKLVHAYAGQLRHVAKRTASH